METRNKIVKLVLAAFSAIALFVIGGASAGYFGAQFIPAPVIAAESGTDSKPSVGQCPPCPECPTEASLSKSTKAVKASIAETSGGTAIEDFQASPEVKAGDLNISVTNSYQTTVDYAPAMDYAPSWVQDTTQTSSQDSELNQTGSDTNSNTSTDTTTNSQDNSVQQTSTTATPVP